MLDERDGNRVLSMREQHDGILFTGPVIRLDELVECACALSMDKLMSVLYRNEWLRNNPGKMTGQILSLLADREVLGVAAKIVALYLRTFRKSKKVGHPPSIPSLAASEKRSYQG